MHKKFEISCTEIEGGCHLGRKMVTHNSKSDLPLTMQCDTEKIVTFSKEVQVRCVH